MRPLDVERVHQVFNIASHILKPVLSRHGSTHDIAHNACQKLGRRYLLGVDRTSTAVSVVGSNQIQALLDESFKKTARPACRRQSQSHQQNDGRHTRVAVCVVAQ